MLLIRVMDMSRTYSFCKCDTGNRYTADNMGSAQMSPLRSALMSPLGSAQRSPLRSAHSSPLRSALMVLFMVILGLTSLAAIEITQTDEAHAASYITKKGFPKSYRKRLKKLHKLHPSWKSSYKRNIAAG